jgi:hypothetical protein
MKRLLPILFLSLALFSSLTLAAEPEAERPAEAPLMRRVANIYLSESFLNEQIKAFSAKSQLFKDLHLNLDSKSDRLYLSGIFQVPLDELQTIKMDRSLGKFKFQVAIRPHAEKNGNLRLEFPLEETYFHLASSKNPTRDRVVVPVQLLSLALASTRGYLAALSGDFSIFDRKAAKFQGLLRGVKRTLSEEQNPDVQEDLKLQKKAYELQLETIAVERTQLERTAKSVANVMSLLGQKKVDLNDEIIAEDNSLTLKLELGKILPYLKDIELAGIRINHDPNGAGEDYFVVGVNSAMQALPPSQAKQKRKRREGLALLPAMVLRINQAVFNSKAVLAAQNEKFGSANIENFDVALQDDGIHVTGDWHKYFFTVPFDVIVDFVSTGPDVFEVRLRKLKAKGIDMKFLTKYALDAIQDRLDKTLAGICTFEYKGEDQEENHVLQVTVEPKNLVPAFPDLHLIGVDVANREFLMQIGHTESEKK